MIRFVDIKTGNVFNGDSPYTHWFDGIQSLGIIYSKQFIVLSDKDSITVSVNSDVFSLVDETKLNEFVTKNDKKYLDLSKITTKSVTLNGKLYQEMYIYSFNLIAKGVYVGEVTDKFTINEVEYNVGADFTDENEALSTNLAGLGMDMPNEIQRAIYEKNIHEQKPDYVLLNRKFKELLNEYINIVANKGSYKSLISSLKWFEYGDLVQIYEYWRHEEPTRKYLNKNDISQYLNKKLESIMTDFQKTTYISLNAALTNCKMLNGEIQYIPENKSTILHAEPLPIVENVVTDWTRTEMSLKMVLLGNFFATYFMPIHLDLIHCTIEDIVFSDTIKIAFVPQCERFDNVDNLPSMSCKLNSTYHLDNIETYTNANTPFGFIHSKDFTSEDEALEICGVEESNDETQENIIQAKTIAMQHFKGIGVMIPFNCVLHNVGNNFITSGTIYVYKNNTEEIVRTSENITHVPENDEVNINFNLLIQKVGDYTVQLLFTRTDGANYTGTYRFTVDGVRNQSITMYKLVPRYKNIDLLPKIKSGEISIKKWLQTDDNETVLPFGDIAKYVLDPDAASKNKVYMQFIASSKNLFEYNENGEKEDLKKVHQNQIIVIRAPENSSVYSEKDEYGEDKYKLSSKFSVEGICGSIGIPENILKTDKYVIEYDTPKYSKLYDDSIKDWDSDKYITRMSGDKYRYFFFLNTFPVSNDSNFREYHCTKIGSQEKVWIFNAFVPYLHTLEKFGEMSVIDQVFGELSDEEVYKKLNDISHLTIQKDDVICFAPELNCVKRPTDFMWKYICQSTDLEITPKTWRQLDWYSKETSLKNNILKPSDAINKKYPPTSEFPTIVQPLFGRYDLSVLPDSGYYDVVLQYKLDDNEKEENQTRTVSSQFIVSK